MERNSNIDNQNKVIICVSCGEKFIFEKGEQDFYADKSYPPPKRCPECRRELKLKRRADRQREAQNESR
jgi:uncharacterized protein YbaR (Trm112 family)